MLSDVIDHGLSISIGLKGWNGLCDWTRIFMCDLIWACMQAQYETHKGIIMIEQVKLVAKFSNFVQGIFQ